MSDVTERYAVRGFRSSEMRLHHYDEEYGPPAPENVRELLGSVPWEHVDLDLDRECQSWVNNVGTLVLRLPRDVTPTQMAEYAEGLSRLEPQEINHIILSDGSVVVRYWWD